MDRIGKFIIKRALANTGVSRVLFCLDPDLKVPVAVKLFDPQMNRIDPGNHFGIDNWRARFISEARIMATFDHPNIVAVKQLSYLQDGRPYIVMPYVSANLVYEIGKDVSLERAADLPESERPRAVSVERAITLLRQILRGLAVIHARGMIHRDIKPGNILLTELHGGSVKLCDFGMVKTEDRSLTRSGLWLGTLDYISPEQRESATDVDTRADIFSTGMVGYRLLTGRLPAGSFPAPREVSPDVPVGLSNLVMRAMHPDRSQRPKDAAEMLRLLDRIAGMLRPTVRVLSVQKEIIPAT